MKLDRSKSFGAVYGDSISHSFEQDGRYFDHEGNEVGAAKADLERVAKAVRAPKVSAPPEDPELAAQMKA